MKYALFVGVSDISDLLQYISKVITSSGRKTLLVDATVERFIYYGTPIPDPKMKLIEFEGFDVTGDYSILSDLETSISANNRYDHVIIHCSTPNFLNRDDLTKIENKYVAATTEKWSIEKTVEVLESFFNEEGKSSIEFFSKIIVNSVDSNIADDYLETVLSNLPLGWSDEPFELIFDEIDYAMKINNQHNGTINIRKLSKNYKRVVHRISKEITGLDDKDMKTAMKLAMRRS
ncbi:hypothetical protein ACP8HI_10020 [Paenibacillus sp. FA6]|uniref:hypothetical protein n=1 Tax=Paenibacillus sp. FA6 TaxID=3413029 RepID=UPI003F65E86E